MAFTDDGVKAKLSALNETQDSIVTVSQWIMFHRYFLPSTMAVLCRHSNLQVTNMSYADDMPIEQHSFGCSESKKPPHTRGLS